MTIGLTSADPARMTMHDRWSRDVPVLSGPGLVPGVIGAAALAQLSVSSAGSPASVGRLSVMIPVSGSDDT
jgi:CBS domain-containing protein